MGEKENLEKSEIQRWSITSISFHNLPEQLKSFQTLNKIDDMDVCHDDVDTYDYSNWRVFELWGKINPKKYVKYPELYKILLDLKSDWGNEKLLILQKQTTKKFREKTDKILDIYSNVCNALIGILKESKSKSDFYDKSLKYRDEIASAVMYGGKDVLGLIESLWEAADELWKWEGTTQDVDEFWEYIKERFQVRKSVPPVDNRIFYMQWSKEEIKELRKKFIENWSNVFIVS